MPHPPWDLAGPDSLYAAKTLFGEAIDHLAPFQSLETTLQGRACSVLRLCDRNFRIAYTGRLDHMVAALDKDLWVKQFDWLGSVSLPVNLFSSLTKHAKVRPPHRLTTLPNHCAVPAQLNNIPVLIWRHPVHNQPTLDLHVANTDLETLTSLCERLTPDN
ncbi:MAG: hypothetical protein AAFV72_23185 [Cyanobacteria bacterium J06635_1]